MVMAMADFRCTDPKQASAVYTTTIIIVIATATTTTTTSITTAASVYTSQSCGADRLAMIADDWWMTNAYPTRPNAKHPAKLQKANCREQDERCDILGG